MVIDGDREVSLVVEGVREDIVGRLHLLRGENGFSFSSDDGYFVTLQAGCEVAYESAGVSFE